MPPITRLLPPLSRRAVFGGLAAAALAPAVPAAAQVRIDITRGRVDPVPTAISPFFGEGPDAATGAEVAKVIAAILPKLPSVKAVVVLCDKANMPESYLCDECDPRPLDAARAHALQVGCNFFLLISFSLMAI